MVSTGSSSLMIARLEGGCALANRIGVVIRVIITDRHRYVFCVFPDRVVNWCDDNINGVAIFDVGIRAIIAEAIAVADCVVNS
jgi:hypothetical protein